METFLELRDKKKRKRKRDDSVLLKCKIQKEMETFCVTSF